MSFPIQFSAEEMYPYFKISGSASFHEGTYPGPTDTVDPSNGLRNIKVGQDWFVLIQWDQVGSLVHGLSGTWYVQVFFEKMGPGEVNVMPVAKPVPFTNDNPGKYVVDVPFIGDSLNVKPGLYKVAVSLTLKGPSGIPLPVAAVAEGPVIQFYEAGTKT